MARFISPGISSTTATAGRFRRTAARRGAAVVTVVALVAVVLVAAGSRAAGRSGAASRGGTAGRLGSAAGLLAAGGLTAGRGTAATATMVLVESLGFRSTDDGEQAGHKQGRENVTESHERAPSGQLKGFLLANPAERFSKPDMFGDRLVAPRSSYGCYRRWQERSLIPSPLFSTSLARQPANERKTRGIPAVPLLTVESRALVTA